MEAYLQQENDKTENNENLERESVLPEEFNPKKPKVSVIMAVYNTKEEWLKEAIESILKQTYKNFELIIIDDGSTNNIKKVITLYADERIRYIYQNNQGVARSRNNGIQQARGEYIAIMDSDDISLPTRLEKQLNFLDNNKQYSIVGSWIEIFPHKKVEKRIEYPKYLDNITTCFFNATVMFRKSDFDKLNVSYDECLSTAEDYDLFSRICNQIQIYNIQEALYLYRIDGQGITTSMREERYLNTIKIQQKMLDFLTNDKKMQAQIVDILYKKQKLNKTLLEKIFSLKNHLVYNKMYKVCTLLGIEFRFVVKEYECG